MGEACGNFLSYRQRSLKSGATLINTPSPPHTHTLLPEYIYKCPEREHENDSIVWWDAEVICLGIFRNFLNFFIFVSETIN